ncbi:MAG: RNA-binding transcriptional accessory protein, partial [Calditrichaeota bacterium]|nr:RNA-binding transcriptional accessory protein [Calditrichota bacterium]
MSEQEFYQIIAQEMSLRAIQVTSTVELLDDGNTVPFIARYRKEVTGKLDEEQIRQIEERIKYLRMLSERKSTILKSIEEQGKLTPELAEKIEATMKLQELEDLYLPYRPKKRTRATIAKEKGLEPLAELILKQDITSGDPFAFASEYIDPEKGVENAEEALAGARDIIAEVISDDAEVRKAIRERTRKIALIVSTAKDPEAQSDYEMYYDFSEPVSKIVPHRILAINRGEREKILKVSIEVQEEVMLSEIQRRHITNRQSIFRSEIETAAADSYKRLIAPSIEREIRNELSERADDHAIHIFATNLKNLLMQPPVKDKIIMGIDPA